MTLAMTWAQHAGISSIPYLAYWMILQSISLEATKERNENQCAPTDLKIEFFFFHFRNWIPTILHLQWRLHFLRWRLIRSAVYWINQRLVTPKILFFQLNQNLNYRYLWIAIVARLFDYGIFRFGFLIRNRRVGGNWDNGVDLLLFKTSRNYGKNGIYTKKA